MHGCNTRQCEGREWVLRADVIHGKVMMTHYRHDEEGHSPYDRFGAAWH